MVPSASRGNPTHANPSTRTHTPTLPPTHPCSRTLTQSNPTMCALLFSEQKQLVLSPARDERRQFGAGTLRRLLGSESAKRTKEIGWCSSGKRGSWRYERLSFSKGPSISATSVNCVKFSSLVVYVRKNRSLQLRG